jgi:hypothetical protein
MMKPRVSTRMMTTSMAFVIGPAPETMLTPVPICMAAMPRAAAVPNRVATMAKMSTSLPAKPSVCRLPKRVTKIDDSSRERPRR